MIVSNTNYYQYLCRDIYNAVDRNKPRIIDLRDDIYNAIESLYSITIL